VIVDGFPLQQATQSPQLDDDDDDDWEVPTNSCRWWTTKKIYWP